MAIGIDRYQSWARLHNAVNDARGAVDAFKTLGFELVREPLFDQAATRDAMQRLVTDDLRALGPSDSLVVFFAGHGHTLTTTFPDQIEVKTGYLIPVGADRTSSFTWLRVDSWLSELARLPPRHILVILDACHSGVALTAHRYRGDMQLTRSMEVLRARRSRRIITSALEDQLALDSGPLHGHSLFTGCLIQALTDDMPCEGRAFVTGSEIGLHVQSRVTAYASSKQTPDFGVLELDNRGDLIVELRGGLDATRSSSTPRTSRPVEPEPVPAAPLYPVDRIRPSASLPDSGGRQWGSDDIRPSLPSNPSIPSKPDIKRSRD